MAKKAKAVEVKAPKVLDLKSIKEAFKKKDVKALVQNRAQIMQFLGGESKRIQDDIQKKISEDVMPKVNECVDKFCADNNVTVVGFYDLDKISATVVNATQYGEFINEIRRSAPTPNWTLFEKLQEKLKKELSAMIVGIFNPQHLKPTWTIKTKPEPKLHNELKELMIVIEESKATFKKIDEVEAVKSAEVAGGEVPVIPENK